MNFEKRLKNFFVIITDISVFIFSMYWCMNIIVPSASKGESLGIILLIFYILLSIELLRDTIHIHSKKQKADITEEDEEEDLIICYILKELYNINHVILMFMVYLTLATYLL